MTLSSDSVQVTTYLATSTTVSGPLSQHQRGARVPEPMGSEPRQVSAEVSLSEHYAEHPEVANALTFLAEQAVSLN